MSHGGRQRAKYLCEAGNKEKKPQTGYYVSVGPSEVGYTNFTWVTTAICDNYCRLGIHNGGSQQPPMTETTAFIGENSKVKIC